MNSIMIFTVIILLYIYLYICTAQVTKFLTNNSASIITLRALSVMSADEIITQLTYCGVYTGYLSEVV